MAIKIDRDSGGNLRARIDKSAGLTRKERKELVDLLRKNMLYQTPKPIFADGDDEHPTWVEMRMLFTHQQRVLQLIHKAGGWVMPPKDREVLLKQYEERSRISFGDGFDYDFQGASYGDLVAMYQELKGIKDPDLVRFRAAIADALKSCPEAANG